MKPMLIGMNNPLSTRPGYELYPAPEGCTGHRIWQMLTSRTDCTRMDYIQTFERRNLVVGIHYDRAAAKKSAGKIVQELFGTRRTIVVLGEDVRKAFGLEKNLIHPQEMHGCTWRQLPHPSGRNLWYNSESNRVAAAMLLEELYRAAKDT